MSSKNPPARLTRSPDAGGGGPAPADAALRSLPSVDRLLSSAAVRDAIARHGRALVRRVAREVLEAARRSLRETASVVDVGFDALCEAVVRRSEADAAPRLRRVINATGIILHTGLGRAPLGPAAQTAVAEAACGPSSVEIDLATGRRGDRQAPIAALLRELVGAEDALAVNNNAAATLLALSTFGRGGDVVISRGELVEIGGSYRLPDLVASAGARLVEVGTTNRTRIGDFERAIGEQTRILLRVHTSNYRIEGFTAAVPIAALIELRQRLQRDDITVIDDLGSGLLTPEVRALLGGAAASRSDQRRIGHEPTVAESLAAGADVALFSGDKLLGGPQAGVIAGRREAVRRMRANPLMRALRPGKLTLAALEATLSCYRRGEALCDALPALGQIAAPAEEVAERAEKLAELLRGIRAELDVRVRRGRTYCGGGSLPMAALRTAVVSVSTATLSADELAARLRGRTPAVVARVRRGRVRLDCRTLGDRDLPELAAAVRAALHATPAEG